jgi:hypothetical protein
MARIGPLIWFWSLTILPFTAILTFILTLVICTQVPNKASTSVKFPEISLLGTGQAYYYFAFGFTILVLQLLIMLIGRLQFLLQAQYIINRAIICAVHGVALISSIFLLIMAFVSVDNNPVLHVTGAFGMFGFLSLYCFLHTIIVFYLFKHRSDAPQHTNVIWPIWFLLCSLLLITFFIVWVITATGIPQYIAAAAPFLYFLGFVPQFWMRARATKRDYVLPESVKFSNDISL